MFSIKVLNTAGGTKFVERGEHEVILNATSGYEEGDRIVLEYAGKPCYVFFQADDALGPAFLYITGNVEVKVPFGEQKLGYSKKAFLGSSHYLYVREARKEEIYGYRNLALNVYDNHENTTSFPHAMANVETRNEAVFAARNAIDGIKANSSHGEWPYTSWGINQNPKAWWKLDFGHEIETDTIILYLRADFPHDNWWNQVTFSFSDGSTLTASLEKSAAGQEIHFPTKCIRWLQLENLVKAETQSPFPALTQVEVYGVVK